MSAKIFVRHAHRETSEGPELDNSLSEKGRVQAQKLAQFILKQSKGQTFKKIYTSPKRRCQETASAIAKALNCAILVDPNLDEQGSFEGNYDFECRIEALKEHYDALKSFIVVSHADVLPIWVGLEGHFVSKIKKGNLVWLEAQRFRFENPEI